MNEQNLVPVTKRSKTEAREISRKGGIVSGIKRRKNRDMIEALHTLMSAKVRDENGELVFVSEAVAENIVCAALAGDFKFTRLLTDYLYGTPHKRTEQQPAAAETEQRQYTIRFADTINITTASNSAVIQEQLTRMDDEEFLKLCELIDLDRQRRGI